VRLARFTVPRAAAAALAVGAAWALGAQLAFPTLTPLYDGLSQLDPYRYLTPTGSQPGNPGGFASKPGLDANGQSRAFAALTPENPPQAQLIALGGAFVAPAGSTSMDVTIEPVQPLDQPTAGAIAGNVYRFTVVDDAGNAFGVAPGAQPTITLREPDGVTDAVLGHDTPDGWVALQTVHGGALGLLQAQVTELGDYAVLTGVSPPLDLGPIAAIGLAIGVPLVAVAVYLVLRLRRERRARAIAAELARNRARVPSKRRRRR